MLGVKPSVRNATEYRSPSIVTPSMREPRPLGPRATAGSLVDDAAVDDDELGDDELPEPEVFSLAEPPPLIATATPATKATTAAAIAGTIHRRLRCGAGLDGGPGADSG